MSATHGRRIGRPPVILEGRTVAERLVESALGLFAEKGFERTSVQDIVQAAGVTKGAMYHYFPSKDDLLAEIYFRVLRMQLDRLDTFAKSDAPILERLGDAAADVVATTIENLDSTTIFLRSMHALSEDHEREVRRQRRRYHDMFRQIILDGQATGDLRADADADLVVDYFFGAVHHLPMWWELGHNHTPEDVSSQFARLLIDSLRPEPPLGDALAHAGR
jgi:AcrR family transcriptional regulator